MCNILSQRKKREWRRPNYLILAARLSTSVSSSDWKMRSSWRSGRSLTSNHASVLGFVALVAMYERPKLLFCLVFDDELLSVGHNDFVVIVHEQEPLLNADDLVGVDHYEPLTPLYGSCLDKHCPTFSSVEWSSNDCEECTVFVKLYECTLVAVFVDESDQTITRNEFHSILNRTHLDKKPKGFSDSFESGSVLINTRRTTLTTRKSDLSSCHKPNSIVIVLTERSRKEIMIFLFKLLECDAVFVLAHRFPERELGKWCERGVIDGHNLLPNVKVQKNYYILQLLALSGKRSWCV